MRKIGRYVALVVLVNQRRQILAKRIIQNIRVEWVCTLLISGSGFGFGQILAAVFHYYS